TRSGSSKVRSSFPVNSLTTTLWNSLSYSATTSPFELRARLGWGNSRSSFFSQVLRSHHVRRAYNRFRAVSTARKGSGQASIRSTPESVSVSRNCPEATYQRCTPASESVTKVLPEPENAMEKMSSCVLKPFPSSPCAGSHSLTLLSAEYVARVLPSG